MILAKGAVSVAIHMQSQHNKKSPVFEPHVEVVLERATRVVNQARQQIAESKKLQADCATLLYQSLHRRGVH
jgi:hypothetical protein